MKRLAGFWKQIAEGWTVQRIAAVLIVVGLLSLFGGYANKYCEDSCAWIPYAPPFWINSFLGDFYANVSVDCLSIAFAILVIDRLNGHSAEQDYKEQLIREMGSRDNGIALRAVRELRAHGWLTDGSLSGANLWGAALPASDLLNANLSGVVMKRANLQSAVLQSANLQGAKLESANLTEARLLYTNLQDADLIFANLSKATLHKANLQEANLFKARLLGANLEGANLRGAVLDSANLRNAYLAKANFQDAQGLTAQALVTVRGLCGATLPNGSRYDGRLNLNGDFFLTGINAGKFISTDDSKTMARYYGVSLEDYLAGQEWAREHLADLRRAAGLDPDTGEPLPPTNGVEPQPADVPAQPAPRRNGHKASLVSHRTRR